MTLRIGVDGSSAVIGGGVRYLLELVPQLALLDSVEVTALLARPAVAERLRPAVRGEPYRAESRWSALGREWRSFVKEHCDVVLCPTELSLSKYQVPTVMAIRNPCLLPVNTSGHPISERAKYGAQRGLARARRGGASHYVAVSEYAKHVGEVGLGIRPSKISVIYHGGPSVSAQGGGAQGDSYRFLFLSNLNRYKGLETALEALESVEGDWYLDVVGGAVQPDYYRRQRALADSLLLSDRVEFHGRADPSEAQRAYAEADCLIWPSTCETFGHPLVEAAHAGLRVVACDAGSNREIAGNAAVYFRPGDVIECRQLLEAAIAGEITPGPLPREYDWGRCAWETACLLHSVALR